MRLRRPRQWGACWLAGQLWRELQLDDFWADRLPPEPQSARWDQVLHVLVSYRLIAPGSEWKLHRDWRFGKDAMADLLGADFGLAGAQARTPVRLSAAAQRRAILTSDGCAGATCLIRILIVLLYDLTSTYFEINRVGRGGR